MPKAIVLFVRGIPGSGKTSIVNAFIKGRDHKNIVRLDPDLVITESSEFITFCDNCPKNLPNEKRVYRYLLYKACDALAVGKIVIWEQPWRNCELLQLTIDNLTVISGVMFSVGIIDVSLSEDTAKERVERRFQLGQHPLNPEHVRKFAESFQDVGSTSLSVLKLDGSAEISTLVLHVEEFLEFLARKNSVFVYLIRHLPTVYNRSGIYMGRSNDLSIIPQTIGQFQTTISRHFSSPIHACIYTSPAKRCMETAMAFADFLKITRNIEVDNNLQEMDHGLFEGKLPSQIKRDYTKMYQDWMEKPSQVSFPNGESFAEVMDRATSFLWRIIGKAKNDTIILFTHVDVIKMILCWVLGVPIDNKRMFCVDNGSVTCLEKTDEKYNPKKIKVRYFNGT